MQNQELPLYTESAKLKLVHVPLIPDGQPGSVDLAEKVLTAVSHTSEDTTAFLMEAHGVLILGETMENCFHQAELLVPPPAVVEAPHLPQAHLRLTPPPLLQTL